MADSPHAATAGDFADRRLHPATIVIDVIRRITRLLYLIVIIVVLSFTGGGRDRMSDLEFVAGAIALFGIVSAVLRYVSMRYGFEGDRLIIRSGILNKQKRTIPVDRVQNLQVQRGVLHRVFGVVDLRIETAVAGGAEALLSSVSQAAADELRREIAKRRGGVVAEEADTAPVGDDVVYRASPVDLFVLGSTANRAGVIIGAASGLFITFQNVIEDNYDKLAARVPALAELDRSSATFIAVAILAVLFVGWIISIITTFITYFGFVLRKRDDRLIRQYGLLTNIESVVTQRRIQSLRILAPWLRRCLNRATLYAESAGSFGDKQASGSSPLCPLTVEPELARLCQIAIPSLDYSDMDWQRVSRKTIRRGFFRYARLPVLFFLGLGFFVDQVWWLGVHICIVIAAVMGFARYRAMGYADENEFIASRYGVLTRETRILPRSKVQHVGMKASFFQRRRGLATLHIATAGSNSDVPIIDLPRDVAENLLDKLSNDAAAAGAWLPDGV